MHDSDKLFTFAHMKRLINISTALLIILLLPGCKSVEHSTEIFASQVKDSIHNVLVDSNISRFFIDSVIYRVFTHDTIVEFQRVRRGGSSLSLTKQDTVFIHERDTVTVAKHQTPSNDSWSLLKTIGLGFCIVIAGLLLSQLMHKIKGGHWYGFD